MLYSIIVLLFTAFGPIRIDGNVAARTGFVARYTQWTSNTIHGSVPGIDPERLDINGTARIVVLAPAKGFNRERFSFSEIDATTKAGKTSRAPSNGTFTIERDSSGTPSSPDLGPLGYIPALPPKYVSVGDEWTAQVPVAALDGKGTAQYRYRLDALQTMQGHAVARISLVVRGRFVPGGKLAGWTGTESGEGSITWDLQLHERRAWSFEIRDVATHGTDSVVATNGLRADWVASHPKPGRQGHR